MALTDAYVQVYGQLGDFFDRIADGQAPERFTRQHLKDLGFRSSNFNAVIPLLKELKFLSADGTPTDRYHDYRDRSQSRRIMGEALRDAYADLFVINANPTEANRALIEGKFKSAHNTSERVAKLMANTFFSLLALADLQPHARKEKKEKKEKKATNGEERKEHVPPETAEAGRLPNETSHAKLTLAPTLHYNIQIHLPATKDVEVFNAIFKSLKEHLLA
jgi:hypothetical protein